MYSTLIVLGIIITICIICMGFFWKKTHKGTKKANNKIENKKCKTESISEHEKRIDYLITEINNF